MSPHHHPTALHDHVTELTRVHTHREHYTTRHHGTWYGQYHNVTVPPLLTQLAWTPPTLSTDNGGGYASRPAASLNALDTLAQIDHAAASWLRRLGKDDPGDTSRCIRLLASLVRSQPPATSARIAGEVRAWWTWARIVTGWDSPAWRPDNTCPLCGTRGTLRVKLDAAAASCTECRETWDAATMGLLADHIREENHDPREWCAG